MSEFIKKADEWIEKYLKKIFIAIVAVLAIIAIIDKSGTKKAIEQAKEDIKEDVEQVGGEQGIKNNINEMTRDVTDLLGVTDREEILIDDDGTISMNTNSTNSTDTAQTTSGDITLGLNETASFETAEQGIVEITFTGYDYEYDVYEKIPYLSYTVKNVGDCDVRVDGETYFAVYGDNYKINIINGESSVNYETLSKGREIKGRLYLDTDFSKVDRLEVEAGETIFVIKDNQADATDTSDYVAEQNDADRYDSDNPYDLIGSWRSADDGFYDTYGEYVENTGDYELNVEIGKCGVGLSLDLNFKGWLEGGDVEYEFYGNYAYDEFVSPAEFYSIDSDNIVMANYLGTDEYGNQYIELMICGYSDLPSDILGYFDFLLIREN